MPQAAPPPIPPPPPAQIAPAPEAVSLPGEGVQLFAGLGFGRYSEATGDVSFEADVEPQVKAGGEASFTLGRGQAVIQASGLVGSEVDMHAAQAGMTFQNNQFHQQQIDASPRLRWPINPTLYMEGGYRLTYQRLFFDNIVSQGQMLGGAEEDVTVHALEFGGAWHRSSPDGGAFALGAGLGLNHGSAQNSVIQGGDFTATGHSFWLKVDKRWPSGLLLEGAYLYRQQHGSSPQNVTFMGMPTQAVWPQNTTWSLIVLVGYLI